MTRSSVTFNYCDVTWQKPPETIYLTDAVDVWRIQVTPNLQSLPSMETLLQPDEVQIASRFHKLKDKERFIIRRGALRVLLSKYLLLPARNIQFILDENKKPFLKQSGVINLNYNVSHSGDWILIALADSNLGVDIEQTDRNFAYDEVLYQSFSPREIDHIQQSTSPERQFFKLWTRKEALIKATSKGLDDDLPAIPCLDGIHRISTQLLGSENDWIVSSFEVSKSYTGSVACPPRHLLRFWDFEM